MLADLAGPCAGVARVSNGLKLCPKLWPYSKTCTRFEQAVMLTELAGPIVGVARMSNKLNRSYAISCGPEKTGTRSLHAASRDVI